MQRPGHALQHDGAGAAAVIRSYFAPYGRAPSRGVVGGECITCD